MRGEYYYLQISEKYVFVVAESLYIHFNIYKTIILYILYRFYFYTDIQFLYLNIAWPTAQLSKCLKAPCRHLYFVI